MQRRPWFTQIHYTHPSILLPTYPSKEVMMTLINNMKTYATVAAMKSTPHIQDQKATGRPKGITATGCSTMEVRAIKLTTDWSYQGTTGSSMGETKAHKKTQPQDKAKAMLCKALYEIFDIKELIVTEVKNPIKVNALCFAGKSHHYGMGSQVDHQFYRKVMRPQDNGHKYALPTNKLRRNLECFHCHKKGHFACNCKSRPTLPVNQLVKKIQENKSANKFNALKEGEENLDQINSSALLDAQKIKRFMAAPKHTMGPAKIKAMKEFITENAHKFNEADRARIINLYKPKSKSNEQRLERAHAYLKSKPTVMQLGDAHAYPKSKPSVKQMGDALKEQIQTMVEDTKIRMLNKLIPKNGCDVQKIETLARTFRLDSVFVNKSNSVQVQFMLVSYKRETKEIGLLDTGATENFIDSETIKKLCLGMKELPYQRPIFNVDGTPNRQGKISHYCNLMVSKGNI